MIDSIFTLDKFLLNHKMIIKPQKYDGHILHQRFAFRYFGNKVSPFGNIIAFRGAMEVLADAMIDQEDTLIGAFIYSEDAVNFLWEMPILGNNAFAAVAYQRLFNTQIADILGRETFLNKAIKLQGDDLIVKDSEFLLGEGKCSVSITHIKDNVALGHTGINIFAGRKAPQQAYSTRLTNTQTKAFMCQVITMFDKLNQSLFVATTKVSS